MYDSRCNVNLSVQVLDMCLDQKPIPFRCRQFMLHSVSINNIMYYSVGVVFNGYLLSS